MLGEVVRLPNASSVTLREAEKACSRPVRQNILPPTRKHRVLSCLMSSVVPGNCRQKLRKDSKFITTLAGEFAV